MVMRVTGLASGMNIDEIVDNLIRAESIPLDKMKQEETLLEWKRDSYREMNTLLLNFRSELTNMRLSSFYRTRSVSSTNDSLVSATVASGAGQGTYRISDVTRLASAASKVNAGGISNEDGSKVDVSKSLFSMRKSFQSQDFGWKQGSVETKTIVANESTRDFSLELEDGIELIDTANMTVKVNGRKFEVVQKADLSSMTAEDKEMIPKDQVWVDSTGQMVFGEEIKENSSIKVDYVTNQKVETRSINDEVEEISLRGALVGNSVSFMMNGKLFVQGTDDQNIYLADENGTPQGEAYGEIDFEAGKIKLNDEFRKLVTEDAKELNPDHTDSNTKPTVEIEILSKQYYFSFGLSTHTSEGQVDETYLVQGSESLNQVMSKVNGSDAGVTMFYDSFTDQVTLTRKETGNFNENGHEIETNGSFINSVLRFEEVDEIGGENAEFVINGLKTERTSNTFSMNGVTFTLKNTSSADSIGGATINVNSDNDTLFENIKGFIEKYNELVEEIEKKLNEPTHRDYKPLTELERERLTDKQQEKWEDMARSGLLRNDNILSSFINQMRTTIYSPVSQDQLDPAMRSLSAIGITTTADFRSAKLEINESKLKEAINNDPRSIELLFNGTGVTESQRGVIQRLTEKVNQTMDQLRQRGGNSFSVNHQFTLGRQMDNLDQRIERFEDRLTQLETRYYRQFTEMEKAIQRSNSQAGYLYQFFS